MKLLKGLKPASRKKAGINTRFVPVIFANGRDNDLPGLVAAARNEHVQFDDRIYEPDETLTIVWRTLAFSCSGLYLVGCDEEPQHPVPHGWVVIREAHNPRKLTIGNCHFRFGIVVQP